MLVLSRKTGQTVFIGEAVVVTIVGIDRGKVRLGIEAPRAVSVDREELLTQDQAERIRRKAAARDYAGPAQDADGDQPEFTPDAEGGDR